MTTTPSWEVYRSPVGTGSTVVGDLRVLHGLPGPPNGPDRDILVHLPDGAATSGRRYPALYLHDGQNLFDAATSHVGEWRVDETLALLAGEGIELIVVGIPNAGDGRYAEYTPYRGRATRSGPGGRGRAYLRWLVETVKPAVDAAWPTRPGRETTGIAGSSLGGLISLWAAVAHADTFGLVGSMSTAITPGQREVIRRLAGIAVPPVRAYVDVGWQEGSDAPSSGLARQWSEAARRESSKVREALAAAGLREPETLRYREDPGGQHREDSWAARLPDALRFLFGPLGDGPAALDS